MSHFDNVIDIRRPVEFSIDGRAYRTSNRWQAVVNRRGQLARVLDQRADVVRDIDASLVEGSLPVDAPTRAAGEITTVAPT